MDGPIPGNAQEVAVAPAAAAPSAWAGAPEPPPLPLPSGPLYPPAAIGLGTFFGSPVAGGILMALNYRRLGQRRHARWAIVFGILAMLGLAGLALALPERTPAAAFAVVQVVLAHQAARRWQGVAVERHLAHGAREGSRWKAAGVGVLSGLAVAIILVGGLWGFAILFEGPPGTAVSISAVETIYYDGQATEADARRLGRALAEAGYFNGKSEADVLLHRDPGGAATVSFVVGDGYWDRPDAEPAFRQIAEEVAPAVGGKPIRVRLTDDELETRREFVVE